MSGAPSKVYWLFGLPCAGKTSLARAIQETLRASGQAVFTLDGDELRSGLNRDLGFSDDDRAENLRRAAHVARTICAQGATVVAAFVTPKERHRALVREILGDMVTMVYVDCPLDVCARRDVKGLYAKARKNEMNGLTGAQDPFELPMDHDVRVATESLTIAECVERVLSGPGERRDRPAPQPVVQAAGAGTGANTNASASTNAAPPPAVDAGLRRIDPDVPLKPVSASAGVASGAKPQGAPELRRVLADEAAPARAPEPSLPSFAGAAPPGEGAAERPRGRRRRGRFIERKTFFSSPLRTALVASAGGAIVVWLWWLAGTGSEKKALVDRMLEGDSAAAVALEKGTATGGSAERSTRAGAATGNLAAPPKEALPKSSRAIGLHAVRGSTAQDSLAAAAGDQGTEEAPRLFEKLTQFEPPDAAGIRQRAQADMQRFFKAGSWKDKLPFVRNPERTGPLMESFYGKQSGKDVEPGNLAATFFERSGSAEILGLVYAPAGVNSIPVELFLLKQPDKSWKLDWESYSGVSEMSWEDLAKQRPTQPILLRARAQPGDYFNYEFEDFDKFVSVRLDEPRRRGFVLFAFCEKESPLAKALEVLFKASDVPAVTVRVAFPPNAQSDRCVHLLELVADSWLLLN